jgi:hypothetical protein
MEQQQEWNRAMTEGAEVGRGSGKDTMASALGWFSIGLGALEVLAPEAMGRALGVPHRKAWIRACGVREIGTGIGLLRAEDKAPWLWARVAGDAVDLALLGAAYKQSGGRRGNVALAIGSVAAVTALDALSGSAQH